MRIAEFDYELPEELIAQHPVIPRDASRMLVLHRDSGAIEHRRFRDLPAYLRPDDLLVVNDTRVIPARLLGRKAGTGGQAEVLLLKTTGTDIWEALVRPGRRLRPGAIIAFGDDALRAEILTELPTGGRIVRLLPGENAAGRSVHDLLHAVGELPLPPYITNGPPPPERESAYQTVYARIDGSSAAPTAGLHFTETLFAELAAMGVRRAFVTLHVGLGTFKPVQTEDVEAHEMHEEFYSVPAETVDAIRATKAAGGRVVAIGTTSTRTLESAVVHGELRAAAGATRLFITPGYPFNVVDVQLTNFHMPRSTLLLLIAAFAGREHVLRAYREAVKERYRFLSFGDAMLLI